MMDWLENTVARIVSRLLLIEARRRARLRDCELARSARIHPEALVGSAATIKNYSGDPSRVVVGSKSSIQGHLMVMPQGGRILIGDKSLVGPDSRIWSAASITIGSYVMISHNVNVHDNISHSLSWKERREEIDRVYPHLNLTPHSYDLKAEPVVIEDDAWIGFNASIMRGVRIGRGAAIGAGTMVTADVPPFSVVVGNPMRIVKTLDQLGAAQIST